MPYRPEEGFSWETIDRPIHTQRIIAALVLVAVGWGVGFFAGRMSAWIFPVAVSDRPAVAAVQNTPPARRIPAAQTSPQPASPPSADDRQAAAALSAAARTEPPAAPPSQTPPSDNTSPTASPSTASATTAGTVPGKTPSTKNDRQPEPAASGTADEPPGQRIRPAGQGFALVNPNWNQERPRARQRDAALIGPRDRDGDSGSADVRGSEADVIACERRYASFRRSDGTYQPYGRNSRELCPLLR